MRYIILTQLYHIRKMYLHSLCIMHIVPFAILYVYIDYVIIEGYNFS